MNTMVYTVLFVLFSLVSPTLAYTCQKNETVCELTLTISHELTMNHQQHKAVYPFKGKLYKYDVTNTSSAVPIPADEVIVSDGFEEPRLVVVANKQLPAPDIIVYEGQRLKIHLVNRLLSDSVSIHWHGLPQIDSPWMDGVAFITQCPILPQQTFTYDFIARPKGTYWYHSHVGSQRSKGLFGALIIRERSSEMPEHILQVNGWNHAWDSDVDHAKMNHGLFEKRAKWATSESVDGGLFSRFKIHSALINGRGRYYDPDTGNHNHPPLTVYDVTPGQQYRLRIINTGALYPFEISIDNHRLVLVASDGYDLKPEPADAIIINPGERYDVIVTANQTVGNYWVRAQTLESNRQNKVEAILHYTGAPNEEPMTNKTECTESKRCLHLNCPFSIYPPSYYTDCKRFDEFRSAVDDDPAPQASGNLLKEHFLNFAFPGFDYFPGSVNGKQFNLPSVSALTQPYELGHSCDDADCGPGKICKCMHSLTLHHNDIVQMVFMNMGSGKGWAHPIHMHGYSFYVLKMGYASQNSSTGKMINSNADIDCQEKFCNNATWANRSWLGGNIPGVEIQNAPRKDTLIVPSGGYAVIRIKADNPGVWFMHCHIELHATDGMAMVLNNSYLLHPKTPKGFPVCHDFPPSSYRALLQTQVPDAMTTTETPVTPGLTRKSSEDDAYTMKLFWVVFAVFGLILLIMGGIISHLYGEVKKYKPKKPEKGNVYVVGNRNNGYQN